MYDETSVEGFKSQAAAEQGFHMLKTSHEKPIARPKTEGKLMLLPAAMAPDFGNSHILLGATLVRRAHQAYVKVSAGSLGQLHLAQALARHAEPAREML